MGSLEMQVVAKCICFIERHQRNWSRVGLVGLPAGRGRIKKLGVLMDLFLKHVDDFFAADFIYRQYQVKERQRTW